ncbi:MAG: hypothetical protein ACQKBW_08090, partial [Puniceicoccales bacterium]
DQGQLVRCCRLALDHHFHSVVNTMTMLQIQEEIKRMSSMEQDKLASFLNVLRKMRDPSYQKELKDRRNDAKPESWVSLEEMKKRLGKACWTIGFLFVILSFPFSANWTITRNVS